MFYKGYVNVAHIRADKDTDAYEYLRSCLEQVFSVPIPTPASTSAFSHEQLYVAFSMPVEYSKVNST